jgi:sugar phosphate isomerase/epimerase
VFLLLVLGAIQDLTKIGTLLDIWADAGADGVAFTVPIDALDKRFFDNAKTARDRGMRVLVHPAEYGKFVYTPTDPAMHSIMLERLGQTIDAIKTLSLEPLLVIHPPRLASPGENICGKKEIDEKTALENSLPFFDKLSRIASSSSIGIAIENMHDPYANGGHSLYGYTTLHLDSICKGRDFGICVDTGHAKLSRTSVSEYVNSSLSILTVHLQGNDGSSDQHSFPTMKNIGDVEGVLKLLKLDIPITIEANSFELLKKAELSREKAVQEAAQAVEAVKNRTLPEG